MQAVTLHPSPVIPAPRRRWQFGLRTLLGVVTLAAVLCGAASWWVMLPVRTWNAFVARVQIGDIEGANALCDVTTMKTLPDATPSKTDLSKRPVSISLAMMRQLVSVSRPMPRTWADLLQGVLRIDSPASADEYFINFGVRQGTVVGFASERRLFYR